MSLFQCARAAAAMDGRDFLTPDDVKAMATAVLRHRVVVSPELEVEGGTADDALRFAEKADNKIPMTIRERAYTSPIWYTP